METNNLHTLGVYPTLFDSFAIENDLKLLVYEYPPSAAHFLLSGGSIMRIGVGKKVGNFYVGISVSGKKVASGAAMMFLWPFYLMYYVCIWPFAAIINYFLKNSSHLY